MRDGRIPGSAPAVAATPLLPTLSPQVGGMSSADQRAAFSRALHLAPWQMSAEEFDAAAEPFLQVNGWASQRMFGLTVSTMRFGIRLRLRVPGGPDEGYLADVEAEDTASLDDPRRAFVVDALAQGHDVPADVLADYPDLPN